VTLFRLSKDHRSEVLRLVQSIDIVIFDAFAVSRSLCDRIDGSVLAYQGEEMTLNSPERLAGMASLVRLLLAFDPSIVLIRACVASLPEPLLSWIEARALRLADQVPACANVGSDLLGWAKAAAPSDQISLLRLCVVEGGAVLAGQMRPTGRQSAPHFEPVVFGRGRAVPGLPKLEGGRPADNAEVRLIAHLAVDWLESTGVEPEAGRDGNSAFSGLVYSVFGWLDIEDKAQHCLRQYWKLTKVKRLSRW
jgi:hypothetical protein